MIAGIFHSGSGTGNQLHRYVATRVLALDKGYEFSMVAPELFKGTDFMNLDMGEVNNLTYKIEDGTGRTIIDPFFVAPIYIEWDKHCFDPDINFVEDYTIIDGNFEDERYFGHRLPEIREWLKVEPIDIPDDVCVINFRGGEYKYVPELFLPESYWQEAIDTMQRLNPYPIQFEVHTDDPMLAARFFPTFSIYHDIGLNWRSIRYAKHLILSNSSFAVLPALLNEDVKEIIAPKYWNRYNVKRWDYPQNYYKKFQYI